MGGGVGGWPEVSWFRKDVFFVYFLCVCVCMCIFLLLVLCSVRVTPLCPGPVWGAWDDLIRGQNSGRGGAWRGNGLLGHNSFLHLHPCFVCTRVCIMLLWFLIFMKCVCFFALRLSMCLCVRFLVVFS